MYKNQPPILPPLSTTVGNGEFEPVNGDSHDIKQEQLDGTFESNLPPTPTPSLSPTTSLSPTPAQTDLPSNNNNNHSRMSINQLCNDTTDDEVKEAAAVLENMKQGQGLPPIEIPPHSTQTEHDGSGQMPISPSGETDNTFMSRIGGIGLLRKGMDFYEQGKTNSPFIKMVESQVHRISKPVIEKIPRLASIDQLACRGLDKLEEMMDNNNNNNNNNNDNSTVVYTATLNGNLSSYGPSNEDTNGIIGGEKDDTSNQNDSESRKRRVHGEIRSSSPSYRPSSRTHRTSQSNGSQNSPSLYNSHPNNNYTVSTPTTTVQRSRWQQVLVGAGTAAGAAGAAVSEESMKSLKYCLQWLTYATQHISNQIAALRSIIDSFTSSSSGGALITQSTSKLASIKKEVVDTLRKVIEVVSKYASVCLPEQAKHNVRSFILNLPTKWAYINQSDSSSASPASSPRLTPSNSHQINHTTDYARRLLSLANESLDMLRSVAGIFSETVGRAEAWVERLSSFGVTGGGANAMGPIHFDTIPQYPKSNGNGYVYSQATSSPPSHSPVTPRSRRTSSSARANRRYRTPHPVIGDDDDDDFAHYNNDSDSSSESDAENMRMEMDGRRAKSQSISKTTSHSNGSVKKRKKVGKKIENDRMDLS